MTEKQNDISNSLLAGNFERRSPDAKALSDPIVDTPMVLTLDQLRPYELNPRLTRNPLYDEIKTSILQRGLDTPPSVTRRPGQEHYIIHNGGNTRLKILGELWSETKNEQFFKILCIFKPWKSEIVALTGHLAENELHGKLTFIERALGVGEAQKIYEQESQSSINQSELAKRLTQDGYPCEQSQISRMQDTVNFLLPAIPNALYSGLNSRQIRRLLSLRLSAFRFWEQHNSHPDSKEYFLSIFQETLSSFDAEPTEFDFERFQDELVGQLAQNTGLGYDLAAAEIVYGNKRQNKTEPVDAEPVPLSELSNSDQQIPKDFIKPDLSDVLAQAQSHTSKFVIPKRGNATTGNTAPLKQPACDNESSPPVSTNGKTLIEAHIVSPDETSERVQNIQRMVAHHVGEEINDFSENVLKAIPVQAGGLYPISDVWYIEPAIDIPEVLRTHIEQLAVEIADGVGCKDQIEQDEEGIGFTCVGDSENAILALLGAISQTPAVESTCALSLYTQLPCLLLGPSTTERLSDESLVKLFRLIRLARRLIELTVDETQM
ncbi:ParB family protein [Saezia sanguinis]|uniref:ParB family protein n=1 Tax=Saezia sanguinis TaxID=1965230 RepID=UPI0030297925